MKNFKNFIIMLAILTIGLLTACGQTTETSDTTSEPTETIVTEIPENSILYFNDDEGSTQLMQYFEDGNVPEEAVILYDQMGSNPEITITESDQITKLYNLLSAVTVSEATDETVTDSYHYIKFKLSDDSYISYSFEGSEIWCYDNQNYSIENSSELLSYMYDLTDEYMKQ